MWTTFAFVDTAVGTPKRPPKKSRVESAPQASPQVFLSPQASPSPSSSVFSWKSPTPNQGEDEYINTGVDGVRRRVQDDSFGLDYIDPQTSEHKIYAVNNINVNSPKHAIEKAKKVTLLNIKRGTAEELSPFKNDKRKLAWEKRLQGFPLFVDDPVEDAMQDDSREIEAESERRRQAFAKSKNPKPQPAEGAAAADEAPQPAAAMYDDDWDDDLIELCKEDWAPKDVQLGD